MKKLAVLTFALLATTVANAQTIPVVVGIPVTTPTPGGDSGIGYACAVKGQPCNAGSGINTQVLGVTPLTPNGMSPQNIQADGIETPECFPTVTPACTHQYPYVVEGLYQLAYDLRNVPASAKYPGYLHWEIDFGTQELCDGDSWGTVNFHHIVNVCAMPGYLVIDQALHIVQDCTQTITGWYADPGNQGDQPFVLHLFVPGWALNVQNITFTFTPDR
jgi:hypothetical protein